MDCGKEPHEQREGVDEATLLPDVAGTCSICCLMFRIMNAARRSLRSSLKLHADVRLHWCALEMFNCFIDRTFAHIILRGMTCWRIYSLI